jgi:hypothetical protein
MKFPSTLINWETPKGKFSSFYLLIQLHLLSEQGVEIRPKGMSSLVENSGFDEAIGSSFRRLQCEIRHPNSDIQIPNSDIRHPNSDIRHPTSEIRHPTSEIPLRLNV